MTKGSLYATEEQIAAIMEERGFTRQRALCHFRQKSLNKNKPVASKYYTPEELQAEMARTGLGIDTVKSRFRLAKLSGRKVEDVLTTNKSHLTSKLICTPTDIITYKKDEITGQWLEL